MSLPLTSDLSIEERLQFVRNAKLAIPTPCDETDACEEPVTPFAASKDSAFVVDIAAQSFIANMSTLQREDVANSSLYAQWESNEKFDRMKDTQGWYLNYAAVLDKLGWIAQNISYVKVDPKQYGSVDKAVIAQLEPYLGSRAKLFSNMISALNKSKNEGAYNVFKKNSGSREAKISDFHVGACEAKSDGRVSYRIGYFNYYTQSFDGNVLFFKFTKDAVTFTYDTQEMILNEDIYGKLREEVLQKLGNTALNFIKSVQL